jgi:excinuclease ABC subunit A
VKPKESSFPRELSKTSTRNTLYLLDEPTTGRHFDDINKLLQVLKKIVAMGNTVIVIEINLDVINICRLDHRSGDRKAVMRVENSLPRAHRKRSPKTKSHIPAQFSKKHLASAGGIVSGNKMS